MVTRELLAGYLSMIMAFVEDDGFVLGAGGVHCAGAAVGLLLMMITSHLTTTSDILRLELELELELEVQCLTHCVCRCCHMTW